MSSVAFQWPRWICGAIDRRKRDVCGREASWMKRPTARAELPWVYCDRHRPGGAVRIPADQPYAVTRLELLVAVTGVPGDRAAAADEGAIRVKHAIEAAGGIVVGLQVVGRKASQAALTGPPLRLLLDDRGAGRAAEAPLWTAPRPRAWYLARPRQWGRR